MKQFFLFSFFLLTGIFVINGGVSAQSAKTVSILDNKEVNDSLFAEVKELINAQKTDELYALLDDGFKAKFSKDAFTGILKNNLYPMGPIKEYSFIGYNDGLSAYKATCSNMVLEFRVAAGNDGKIKGLRFLPYKEPVAVKTNTVATSNPLETALDRQVDTRARQYINRVNTTGLCIGIIKDNVTNIYGYGETEKGNRKIPDAYSIFEIGSVTKTFTATLLAYYVTEHKVALSDPVTKFLPDSVAANKELQAVTLQMLANHTSGMARVPDNLLGADMDLLNPYKTYDEKKLYAYLKNCKLQMAPGTQYAYSNLAAGLLGVILEHVSGKPYEKMVEDIICKPLGMASTMQHPNDEQKQRQVSVYSEKGEPVIMWDMDALAGAGAIRSTTNDMLRYMRANMTEDKSPLSKAMQLTHKATYNKEMHIGLGWHMGEISGVTYYWHNGGTGGSRSYMAFMPDKHIAVAVLSNSTEDVDVTGEGILKMLQ